MLVDAANVKKNVMPKVWSTPGPGGLPFIEGRGCSPYLVGVKIKGLVSFRMTKHIHINLSG